MQQKITFTGCQIICSGIVTADITLSNNAFILITGTVYSPTGKPLPNAAVEILLVDDSHIPSEEKNLRCNLYTSRWYLWNITSKD